MFPSRTNTRTTPLDADQLARAALSAIRRARLELRRCDGRFFQRAGKKWSYFSPLAFLTWVYDQVPPSSPLRRLSARKAKQLFENFTFRSAFPVASRGDLGFLPKGSDPFGHPLRAGDYVSPIDHPGDHREAPVYRVHRVCTDGETIHLTREDGSTLYRPASVLRFLPEKP